MQGDQGARLTIAFPKVLGISQLLAIIIALFAGYKIIIDLQAKDKQIMDTMVAREKYYTLVFDIADKEHQRLQKEIDKLGK